MGLDGVELVLAWEEEFGISIPDAAAGAMYTPRDAADWISDRVGAVVGSDCRTRRAFYQVRRELMQQGVPRHLVRLDARVSALAPREPTRWEKADAAFSAAWERSFGRLGGVCSTIEQRPPPDHARTVDSVANLARNRAARAPDLAPAPGERWTREAVALMVRRITMDELGEEWFADDARFYEDLLVD